MGKKKEFSVLKWIIFPAMTLALGAVIVWMNVSVFGWQDGAVYIGVVLAISGFSVAIVKYTTSEDRRLVVTAFVLEILLFAALIVNAAYSLSVQREMSIARQAEHATTEGLEAAGKLRDRRAQRDAVKLVSTAERKSAQQIFALHERNLFWLMVAELCAFAVAAFVLLAVSHLLPAATTETMEEEWPKEVTIPKDLPRP